MTQKEIDKFLANTKVYVNGKSKEIQDKLFSLGYKWSYNIEGIQHTNRPFLYLYNDKRITGCNDMDYFTKHKNREISAEEILSIELTEPAYRPFKNQEECWSEMLKHQPFGWLKNKNDESTAVIGNIYQNEEVLIIWATNERSTYRASKIFNDYIFADGTPFGIKEN